MVGKFGLLLISVFLISCSNIAGLRDKSTTLSNRGFQANTIKSLTILPIKDNSSVVGLSDSIEAELNTCLQSQLPLLKIMNANVFRTKIAESDLINEYAQWRTSYEETKILSLRQIKKWSQVVDSQYCLLVAKVNLSREKIKAVDAGYTGYVNDANNVWRTDLRLFTQMIDVNTGAVVWEGIGHAENIYSPKRFGHDDDDDWIMWNERAPDAEKYIAPIVKMAVDGLVDNIVSGGSGPAGSEGRRAGKQKKDIFKD